MHRGPVALQPPPQRLGHDEYKASGASFSSGVRPPSAGRRPPSGRIMLPDFPQQSRAREEAGYRLGIGVGHAGTHAATAYAEYRPAAGVGSSSSTFAAVRSTSVPRPTSRTASAASAVGGSTAPAAAHLGRHVTRTAVGPGSILDSLKTPSVVPAGNGSVASLAQRVNSTSGWDYTSLPTGGASSSSLRLKRQPGGVGDMAAPAGTPGASSVLYAAQQQQVAAQQQQQPLTSHAHAYMYAPADQLKAIYLSGPAAGPAGGGTHAGSTPAAASPGRRTPVERSVQRTSSFTAYGPAAVSGNQLLPAGSAYYPNLQEQQRLAGVGSGTVYASQYAPQYGSTANTVYIPYSSQHVAAYSATGSTSFGAGAAPAAALAAVGSYAAPGPAASSAAYASVHDRRSNSPHYQTRGLNVGMGSSAMSPLLNSPSSSAVPSAPPLMPPTSPPSGPPAYPGYAPASSYSCSGAPPPVDYSTRTLQRNGSSVSSRGSGTPSGAPAGLLTSAAGASGRLRALGAGTAVAAATGDDGIEGSSNTSLRRLQMQEEPPHRWSGAGSAGPSGAVSAPLSPGVSSALGAGVRALSPRTTAPLLPAAAAATATAADNRHHHLAQAQTQHHQQQYYSTSVAMTGAALDAGGSSYSSNGSSNGSAGSSKSSMTVAPGTGHASSAATSRTTSTTSQRSVGADGAAPTQHHGAAHAHGQPHTRYTASSDRSAVATAAPAPSAGTASAVATAACSQAAAAVCGPLPDLPVVAAARDTPPGRGCVGLQNMGNTCFMNSILQSLNAVPELVYQFYNPTERHWSSKAVVAPAYSALVRDMMSGSIGGCVNPSTFVRKVSKHDSRWGDGRQQDSQEFLNSLLEVLQGECNRIPGKPTYRELQGKGSEEAQAAEAYTYARTWNNSLVDDVFGGLMQSTLQCHACKRTSHTFEPFLGLAVPIPQPSSGDDAVSVGDCLRAFVEREDLEGDNSYKCEACKRCQPHYKRLQIFRPPRVLVLTLKRFSQRGGHSSPSAGFFSRFRGGTTAKNNTAVLLGEPEPLDLTPYCNPLGLRGLTVAAGGKGGGGRSASAGSGTTVAPHYQLIAVSHHSGSLEGGHYTAQARSCLDGAWYNFNDSRVRREQSQPSGASSSAYVMFYRLATLPQSSQISSL